jgi:hypothetical protein
VEIFWDVQRCCRGGEKKSLPAAKCKANVMISINVVNAGYSCVRILGIDGRWRGLRGTYKEGTGNFIL